LPTYGSANPLESLDSGERIQGKPRKTKELKAQKAGESVGIQENPNPRTPATAIARPSLAFG
jgi:hypothetical protein